MGKCCIPTCRNSVVREPGLTFHQIPSNEPWRTEWIDVLGEQGVNCLTEWTLVCAEHFTHEDYKMTARKNFLLQTAVPSIFNPTIDSAPPPKKRGRKPKSQQNIQRSFAETSRPDVDEEYDPSCPRRTGRQRKRKVYKDMVVFMPNPSSDAEDGAVQRREGELPTVLAEISDGDGTHPVQITIPATDEPIAYRTEMIRSEEVDYESSGSADRNEAESEDQAEDAEVDKQDGEAVEFILTSDALVSNSTTTTVSTRTESCAAQEPPKNLNVIVFSSRPRPTTSDRPCKVSRPAADEAEEPRPKRRCCQIQAQRLVFYKSVIVKLRKRVLALEASLQEKEKEIEALTNKDGKS
uniref:THAP-type domain-containing protein n=1 Tax=Ornithodoros turicata TaxID=34597 RepID=A0A2R5LK77_9ACAR